MFDLRFCTPQVPCSMCYVVVRPCTQGTKPGDIEPAITNVLSYGMNIENLDEVHYILHCFDTVTLGKLSDMRASNILYMKMLGSRLEDLLALGTRGLHLFPTTCLEHKSARAKGQNVDLKEHILRSFSICTHNSLKSNESNQLDRVFNLIEIALCSVIHG